MPFSLFPGTAKGGKVVLTQCPTLQQPFPSPFFPSAALTESPVLSDEVQAAHVCARCGCEVYVTSEGRFNAQVLHTFDFLDSKQKRLNKI